MLDRSQWLAIGLVSGFAYILGKDRESFEAESFQAHEYSYYHRNKALKAWRKNYEASGILDDRAKWNELYDSFDKYKSQGFSKGQSMVKSMKEMGIYNQLMQGVNIDAFLDQYSAESFEAEYIHIYDTTITEPEILKKLEGAGIKPIDYYWLTEDIFGLHINSSDADAFQEEFNKKDWTGLYAFDAHGGVRFKRAESFASEGPYSDYECGQCREYGDYNPGEAPAAEEECDSCGDSLCINCYTYDGGLCMSCDGFMSEDEPERVWTILIDDNDAYSETFVFNSKKSAINFREAAMDSEYLQQQDIGVYNIVEQQVINEEYPSDSDIADWLSVDCLKCGDDCGCDN